MFTTFGLDFTVANALNIIKKYIEILRIIRNHMNANIV